MTMTATLDFAPSTRQLHAVRSARRLPVYEAEHGVGLELGARSTAPSSGSADRPEFDAGRIALLVAVAAVIVAGFVVFGSDAAARGTITPVSPDSAVVDATVEVYVVQPGDTLWSIASRVAPAGADLRPIVDQLSISAGGAQLEIGQRLVIDHELVGG